jgi:hypothetical protein
MTYRAAVKTGAMFAESKNKKRGKEFIAFLLQDENLIPYVEGSLGRWYPVTKSGAARLSFWLADPHRTSVQRSSRRARRTFEFTKNYKFTILNNENVWAKAMNRVVSEKWPVEKAVDEMIARIKEVRVNLGWTGRRAAPSASESSMSPSRCRRPSRSPPRPRRGCRLALWGLLMLVPYVLVFLCSCSIRSPTAVARAQPAKLRRVVQRPDLRQLSPQHPDLPDRRRSTSR